MAFRTLCIVALLGLPLGLSACGMTQEKYVDAKKAVGYSATRGRVVLIEGLSSNKIEALSDATAITVSQGKARVTVKFANEQTQAFDLGPGVVILLGSDTDNILQATTGMPLQ